MLCSVRGCPKEARAKGLCTAHYTRHLRYGDTSKVLRKAEQPNGFICPECSSQKSWVLQTRASTEGLRRRRTCKDCAYRFTTMEVAVVTTTEVGCIVPK